MFRFLFVCFCFCFVFVFSGIDFSVDWSAPEGAYCSPHAPSDLYHILQIIYIYVQILGGLCAFFLQFLWLLFLSLVCRNVVLVPQPGTTLLQYIDWLCTQVMAMTTDDVMIGCFFWIFISTWLLGDWDMDAAGRIILVNSGAFSVKIFYSWTLETGTMESHTYKQRGFALEALLEKAGFSFFSSFLSRFRFMLLEVFKCLKKINPKCTNNPFEVKQHDRCLRDGTRLLQPK